MHNNINNVKIKLNPSTGFLLSIWILILPIYFIPLTLAIYLLYNTPLDYWKLTEKESQNNSSLSYDLQSIDNDLLLMMMMMVVMTL
jgi:hypothetical protein